MSSLTNFRDGFTSGMSFLRRRFSSENLTEDYQDPAADAAGFRFYLPPPKASGSHASAPTSPSKSDVQGLRGGGTTPRNDSATPNSTSTMKPTQINRDRCKTLLVVDRSCVDWSKYFTGRKLYDDFDIRVIQAEFSQINLVSYSASGAVLDVQVQQHNGTGAVRCVSPDFVLIRQPVKDATENWRNLIIGLQYGGVPSINSLSSIFNFLDKPWVFSQLIEIERRLGRNRFPLIDQSFFPSHQQMVIGSSQSFPLVVKIGHAHAGMGSVKADCRWDFEDIVGLVAITRCHCTVEPFVESAHDLYVQKIGNNYKAYRKTSVLGNWKVSRGSSMFEQVSMTDRYKVWVDECSKLFGGLDVLAVKAVVTKDGQEFILEVCDSSSLPLSGETQDGDRRSIVDLIVSRMDETLGRRTTDATKQQGQHTTTLISDGDVMTSSMNGHSHDSNTCHGVTGQSVTSRLQPSTAGPVSSRPIAGPPGPSPQKSSFVEYNSKMRTTTTTESDSYDMNNIHQPPQLDRTTKTLSKPLGQLGQHPQQASPASSESTSGSRVAAAADIAASSHSQSSNADADDDTMKNLRKTFAGIFGGL